MILEVLSLAAFQPAAVPVDPVAFDMRCKLLFGELSENDDPQIRGPAETASQFFFGRIDAGIPEADLEARLGREIQAMEGIDREASVQACGTFMGERGRVLLDIVTRLSVRDQAVEVR